MNRIVMLAVCCLCLQSVAPAQPPLNDMLSELHPALLTRYDQAELDDLRLHHPERLRELNTTAWYSFTVEALPGCTECQPPKVSLVNVFLYDRQRLADAPLRVLDPKRGWVITLVSRSELQHRIQQAQ